MLARIRARVLLIRDTPVSPHYTLGQVLCKQQPDTWPDDLTGDDEVTRRDALRMANLIESQKDEIWYRPLIGGLGVYGPAGHRGPFIHVDVRGTFARW